MAARDGSSAPKPIERAVLDHVRDPSYRPVDVKDLVRDLVRAIGAAATDRVELRRVIRGMIRDGRLARISGRRVVAAGPAGAVVGVLERRRDGRTVLTPTDGGDPVEIAERDLGEAREGDTVAVRRTRPPRDGARARGAVVGVVARERGARLGIVVRAGRGWQVRPFEPDERALALPGAFRHAAVAGDVVRYERLPGRGEPGDARVVEVLGPLDAPGVDVEVVCRRHRLTPEFPSDALAEASAIPDAVPNDERARRERFDRPAPVTIDGETARDFDDAVAVETLPDGGWRLYVHIADVAWFVRTGSPLDRAAAARGTSAYFPDRVVPMLPPRLSDDLCSLRPGEDRLVQTVVLDIAPSGRVRRHRVADGIIRSAARLTYEQVAAALDGSDRAHGVPRRLLPMLRDADRLREALETRRRRRGSVDFDLPEPRIQVDLEGVMTGIALRPRNRAHRLIEAFMLAANETVAERLGRRDAPCLYRVHETPDPTKIDALREFAGKFGVEWTVEPERVEARDVQALLDAVEGRPEYPLVAQVALRSMRQARYAVDNLGHFGLAASAYAHFTSPIRRYPDLVVHRAVRSTGRGGPRDEPTVDPLDEVAASCSALERAAEAAERELLEWKKIAFLRDRVGETLDGVVTGVARFGLFVQLTDSLVEGLVRVDRLGGDWFDFDEGRLELRSRSGATRHTLGDRMVVRVDRVDTALRRVELSPADAPDESVRPRSAGSTRRTRRGRPAARGGGGRPARTGRGRRGRR